MASRPEETPEELADAPSGVMAWAAAAFVVGCWLLVAFVEWKVILS